MMMKASELRQNLKQQNLPEEQIVELIKAGISNGTIEDDEGNGVMHAGQLQATLVKAGMSEEAAAKMAAAQVAAGAIEPNPNALDMAEYDAAVDNLNLIAKGGAVPPVDVEPLFEQAFKVDELPAGEESNPLAEIVKAGFAAYGAAGDQLTERVASGHQSLAAGLLGLGTAHKQLAEVSGRQGQKIEMIKAGLDRIEAALNIRQPPKAVGSGADVHQVQSPFEGAQEAGRHATYANVQTSILQEMQKGGTSPQRQDQLEAAMVALESQTPAAEVMRTYHIEVPTE